MTPEARAAALLHHAAEANLLDGYERSAVARWHALVTGCITEALREARDLCRYVPDRIRIGELLVSGLPAPNETGPGAIECFVCDGSGKIGAVDCRACNGMAVIMDSGPMPDPAPGILAIRACGCATDWIGAGAPDAYRVERQRLWEQQGWTSRPADAREAMPLITAGAGGCDRCRPQRATPRDPIGAPDVASP